MLDIYVEFTSFSWQGTKENKPGSEVRETVEENERVSWEERYIGYQLGEVPWERERQNALQPSQYSWGAAV